MCLGHRNDRGPQLGLGGITPVCGTAVTASRRYGRVEAVSVKHGEIDLAIEVGPEGKGKRPGVADIAASVGAVTASVGEEIKQVSPLTAPGKSHDEYGVRRAEILNVKAEVLVNGECRADVDCAKLVSVLIEHDDLLGKPATTHDLEVVDRALLIAVERALKGEVEIHWRENTEEDPEILTLEQFIVKLRQMIG